MWVQYSSTFVSLLQGTRLFTVSSLVLGGTRGSHFLPLRHNYVNKRWLSQRASLFPLLAPSLSHRGWWIIGKIRTYGAGVSCYFTYEIMQYFIQKYKLVLWTWGIRPLICLFRLQIKLQRLFNKILIKKCQVHGGLRKRAALSLLVIMTPTRPEARHMSALFISVINTLFEIRRRYHSP